MGRLSLAELNTHAVKDYLWVQHWGGLSSICGSEKSQTTQTNRSANIVRVQICLKVVLLFSAAEASRALRSVSGASHRNEMLASFISANHGGLKFVLHFFNINISRIAVISHSDSCAGRTPSTEATVRDGILTFKSPNPL